ncbi:alpha-N-acetylgalactosaminidase [Paenibacillus baekrokdamisoli]|uniref:Alpha-N-acetylgalactosaminidase n=1 Tax=Paenibacillus baekrokdamisoli TaxID=1712516 RepID=A0A3G9IST3_9BACL|nr:Gfo/Idh/MocA family oxidoreductase [Paenibacillus baekrokdamisoli]MBB3071568.1 putative dehydrogenase [Paenibacillus baekrokdamisoli]BBH21920.1 alpha-N-acetylgalactosaminidase [Paenibacillus baekrokdamisoli]
MSNQTLRLAIVGGNRGGRFKRTLAALADRLELVAICDLNEEVTAQWKENYPWIETYRSYELMLQSPDIDAVFLASPMLLHARQSIDALKAGKHVLCEVIAAHTLDDAWELVETVEKTGLTYMMAENYCFARSNLAVKHMAEQKMFGEITYLEGGYIHDLRYRVHNKDGSLTWRGDLHHTYDGMNYPTHSIGPISHWLGLNKDGGDRMKSMSTFVSNSRSLQHYFQEKFGKEHPASQPGYWKQGDSAVTNIMTEGGVLISLRVDWTSARPHNMRHYVLQGTEGAYLSKRHDQEDDLVWFNGRSPQRELKPGQRVDDERDEMWEPLTRYQPELDHPIWRRWEEHAQSSGHGGGDFFVLEEFVSSIQEQRSPLVDVYDAVTWSSIFPLSMESHANNGQPVEFPDFRRSGGKRI